MVHTVSFGAFLRMRKVAQAEVDIRFPIFKLLPGYLQRMPAAFAEQFSAEQIKPMIICGTFVPAANLLHSLKLCFVNDCFMGIGRNDLLLWRNRNLVLGLIICDFRFQIDQCAGVDRIF